MKAPSVFFALSALATAGNAQFNDTWVKFELDPNGVQSASPITDNQNEADMDWGDLNGDGIADLVVVRSRPNMFQGARTNVLLLSEGGNLVDRTSTLATASDVPGDQGFLTATQDRDVELVDVDNDGWLEVVTAPDFPNPADPKHITHPRVYKNLGDGGGSWLGLRYEDGRFPTLVDATSGGVVAIRFMAVSSGDVDADGSADLYFGDQDFTTAFSNEPAGFDVNDRLLFNDGAGFFTDVTTTAMTLTMADSNYCNSVLLADMNGDGSVDRLKQSSHSSPNAASIAYNSPTTPGSFLGQANAYTGSPYFVNAGDLNQDGRLDVIISENGNDRFLINTGNQPNGVVNFTTKTYQFLSGGDDSFASNNYVADLDGDGWPETLHCDVDPEISGFNRRLHIYHNLGGTVGGTDIELREERQSNLDTDWIGVVGMTRNDMNGTHDVAIADFDGDGMNDMVISRQAGTVLWRQVKLWEGIGGSLAGTNGAPVLEGNGLLEPGAACSVSTSNAFPNSTAVVVIGFSEINLPLLGGTLVPNADAILPAVFTNALGEVTVPFTWPGLAPPAVATFQTWIFDPGAPQSFAATNALRAYAQ